MIKYGLYFSTSVIFALSYGCIIISSDQVSERSLPPPPPQQPSLHERILAEIKQERKLRPVVQPSSRRKEPSFTITASCSRAHSQMAQYVLYVNQWVCFHLELECVWGRFHVSPLSISSLQIKVISACRAELKRQQLLCSGWINNKTRITWPENDFY